MPPPMPNPSKRMTANVTRPARYRPGKAVQEEESSDNDEEEEEVEPQKQIVRPQLRAQPQRPRAPVQEEEGDDDEEGFITDEDDAVPTNAQVKTVLSAKSTTTAQFTADKSIHAPQETITQPSQEEESEEDSTEEDESSEEESSSEDEPQRKFQRPTFIKRSDRQKPSGLTATTSTTTTDRDTLAASSTPEVDEQTRRLAQADLYIKDKLERDALARSQGKKAWDDDDEVAPEDTVDDTDGLDPEAEHAAWKLRELKRLKRDREAIEAREKEIEEVERRRNLTREERDAEDQEYIAKQKEERDEGRGQAKFLAKYHHKGAFFQDDETAEVLRKRDIMGARFQDDVADKSVLPEYMRVRDMTKLGKKGRTRYTDLKGEDTGRFGDDVKRWKGSGYANQPPGGSGTEDLRGVDERFLPDRDRDYSHGQYRGSDSKGPTGANASAVGQRRERDRLRSRSRSRSRSHSASPPLRRRKDDSRDRAASYRPRRRSSSYSLSRSRSRSPPRRKRSPSPYAGAGKRRRVEVD